MIEGFSFFAGACLCVVSFVAGAWIIGFDKIEYGAQRFKEGRASGIAAQRHENWARSAALSHEEKRG